MTQDKQNRFPPLQELINEALSEKNSEENARQKRVIAFCHELTKSLGNLYPALVKEAQLTVNWDNVYKEPTARFEWCGGLFLIRFNEHDSVQPWNIICNLSGVPRRKSFREGISEVRHQLLLWMHEIQTKQQTQGK